MRVKYLLLFVIFWIVINQCKKAEDKAQLSIIGLNLSGNYYYFEGSINKEITPYCGQIEKASNSSSSSSQRTSGQNTESQDQFDVNSYYVFQLGDYMQIRYTYDTNRKKFTLTPLTSNTSICNTSDFINCSSSGTATCETADNIKCGGAKTFIFVGVVNPLQFQAISGTIEWSKGYALTSDNKYVQKAILEFTMIDKNGNILQGKVSCNSNF